MTLSSVAHGRTYSTTSHYHAGNTADVHQLRDLEVKQGIHAIE